MLQLYAIDPSVFSEDSDFELLAMNFSDIAPHRFLLEAPKRKWTRTLRRKISELSIGDRTKKKYSELLDKLHKDKRLIPVHLQFSEEVEDWLSEYKQDIFSAGAKGIFVVDDSVDVGSKLFSWKRPATEGPDNWGNNLESISMTPEGFGDATSELIQLSREPHIVDPAIWPSRGSESWFDTKKILEPIVQRVSLMCPSGRSRVLTLHTSEKPARPAILEVIDSDREFWEALWSSYPNVRIRFKQWPYENAETGREHDRFFFTELGAISFTNSFQEKVPGQCRVQFLSPKEHAVLKRQYMSNSINPVKSHWALQAYGETHDT